MRYLYRYEARRIQSWILSTDVLKDLKGGSECVERLGELADQLAEPSAQRLVITAGVGMFAFETYEDLQRFAGLWPLIVAHHAPELQLAQAWVAHDGPLDAVPRELFEQLASSPRLSPVRVPEAGPLSARSGRTGLPAVQIEDGLVDAATARKKDLAGESRQRFTDRIAPGIRFEEDLDKWGAPTIGIIHADGNGMGDRFQALELDSLQPASERLASATSRAVGRALEQLQARAGTKNRKLRARIVVVGGDDVTAIVPGEHAIPFAAAYLRAFEQEAASAFESGPPVSACAGIALVKTHFPFHQAYKLAEQLCGEAKCAFERKRSALTFHRVTTSRLEPFEDIRDRTLTHQITGQRITRPAYSLEDLRFLDAVTAAFDKLPTGTPGLPRGVVREWLRLAVEDAPRADLRWQRFQEVSEARSRELFSDFNEQLRQLGAVEGPWTSKTEGGVTPLGDALAWGMVQALRRGEQSRLWEHDE